MVVGGGVAGIQAALDLGAMGIHVHLVEEKPCIGGRMAQLDKTFPTNDCSICILSPKMVECYRHPNITLHTCSEVTGLEGSPGNFEVKILRHARFVKEDCTGCGECVIKCPIRVPDEFDMGLKDRSAIYLYSPQGVPPVVAVDKDHCLYFTKGICRICERVCARSSIDFTQKDQEMTLHVGAIILATGFDLYDPSQLGQYGYRKHRNVITSLEYERLICASGPTGGRLKRPSDGKEPNKIAFIQCVGSRDLRFNRFCSSVCCMHATKEAILAHEHNPDVYSYIFYTDLRAAGKGFQQYISRAERQHGVEYIMGRVAEVTTDAYENPIIWFEDVESSEVPKDIAVDLAVLATSLTPRKNVGRLASILGNELDEHGFFKTDPFFPTDTTKKGIFACGYCRAPADISESVTQASGAAAKAAEFVMGEAAFE